MRPTAYLSAEIGYTPNVPTYSGGLGVLAGDHLKAAADRGLPLVAITLLYRQGYFVQRLSDSGTQISEYPAFFPEPLLEKLEATVDVSLEGRTVRLTIWRDVVRGRQGHGIPILFLDPDHPDNVEEDRAIAHRLYGGDSRLRLRQEALLGIGGVAAIKKLHPEVQGFHLNEGHCALAPLALLQEGLPLEEVREKCHFTTHTPVPAGHDTFDYGLADHLLGSFLPENIKELAGEKQLAMSELALSLCGTVNGVSQLHGEVSRKMFPKWEIGHITNGVHHLTWVSDPMKRIFDEWIPGWREDPSMLAEAPARLDHEALRAAHNECKRELLTYINAETNRGFAPDVLTIGFARRAAAYKRAALLFRDIERLKKICGGKVQFVFAGKAHPKDEKGQKVIADVFAGAKAVGDTVRAAYLSNYTMWTGALVTSGVDVWLNTPERPREASGTSGMKATLNGVPNASIADGWWAEGARDGINGWVIGDASTADDEADAESLYQTLENRIVPIFYGDTSRWISLMKEAVATGAGFTAARMVREYAERYYR